MRIASRGSRPGDRPVHLLLGRLLRTQWQQLLTGGLLSVASGVAALVQPLAARALLTSIGHGRVDAWLVIVLIGLGVVGVVLGMAGGYLLGRAAESIVRRLRRDLVHRLFRLPVPVAARLDPADAVSRVTSDTAILRDGGAQGLVEGAAAALLLLGTVVVMGAIDAVLLGVVVGVLAANIAVFKVTLPRIGRSTEQAQAAVGEMASRVDGCLGALSTVKASRAERRETTAAYGAIDRAWRRGVAKSFWTATVGAVALFSVQLSFLVVVAVGGSRVLSGGMSVPDLVAFLLYVLYLTGPLSVVTVTAAQWQAAVGATRRVIEVLSHPVEAVDGPHPTDAPAADRAQGPAPVTFADVSFRYPGRDTVIHHGLSFEVPAGGLTAIVGVSGAGKTTIFALLERFYNPLGGVIRLDGRDLADWPLDELRDAIAYVEQDAPLRTGSLRDNLTYAAPHVSADEVRAVLRAARLDALVERLPDGLDTPVGYRGGALSGGERQRVAIARALLRRPRLLLLDEATSHLDGESERALRSAIRAAADVTTVLMVAHRLATVADADQIIVLDRGRVRAAGRHAVLAREDELYQRMLSVPRLAS